MPCSLSSLIAGAVVMCAMALPVCADAAVVLPVAELQASPSTPPVLPTPPGPPTPLVTPTPPAAPRAPVAQTLPVPPVPQAPPAPPAPMPQPAAALRLPVPPPPPGKPGQNVNVEIELTITETTDTVPETTVVSVLAADASWGRVRSQGSARANRHSGIGARAQRRRTPDAAHG